MKKLLTLLSRWELLFLTVISGLWVTNKPVFSLVFLILPLLWLGSYWRTGRWFPMTPLDLPLLLLSFWTLLSLAITPDLSASAGKVLGVVLGVSLYFALIRLGGINIFWENNSSWVEANGESLVLLIAAAGTGIAGLGLLGADWFTKFPLLTRIAEGLPDLIPSLPGAVSGFQPNAVSGTLTLFTPLTIWFGYCVFLREKTCSSRLLNTLPDWLIKTGLIFMLFLQVVWWLLSQTRGALLGLAAGLLFLGILVVKSRWKILAIVLPLIPVGAAYTYWFLAENLTDRLYILETLAGSNLTGTLAFRFQVWEWAFFTLQDFPFTGVGYNTFREIAPLLYFGPSLGDVAHAHNIWLDVGVSLGYGGIMIYLALCCVNIWTLWNTFQRAQQSWKRGAALALLAGWYAYFVFGLADTIPLGSKLGLGIFLSLGVGQAISSDNHKLKVES